MAVCLFAGPEPPAVNVWDASFGCTHYGRGPCPLCINVQTSLHYMDMVSYFRDLSTFPLPVAASATQTAYCLPELGLNDRSIDGDRLAIVYLSSVVFNDDCRCVAARGVCLNARLHALVDLQGSTFQRLNVSA